MIEFSLPIRVYIEDTDAGGIVFYANYLKYFERARTELVRKAGYELRAHLNENISYVVHSLNLRYLKPARLDDEVVAHAKVAKLGRTYFEFEQKVTLNEEVLVEGGVKVACTHLDSGKPRALPDALVSALKAEQHN